MISGDIQKTIRYEQTGRAPHIMRHFGFRAFSSPDRKLIVSFTLLQGNSERSRNWNTQSNIMPNAYNVTSLRCDLKSILESKK